MATRTVISYDDITLPYDQPQEHTSLPKAGGQPPAKKRKKNQQKAKNSNNSNAKSKTTQSQTNTFVCDPEGSNQQYNFLPDAEDEYYAEDDEGEYDEESRDLTHEEIWDDSALVDAWESAMEEYKAYHGTSDDWKKDPVKKSPLWYNVPVDPSKKRVNNTSTETAVSTASIVMKEPQDEIEEDSQPLNFDTFVPTHDPSLQAIENASNPVTACYIPETPAGPMVSQDEAFSRALSAMYWGGYWTAMYHAQRQMSARTEGPTSAATPVPIDPEDGLDAEEIKASEVEVEVAEFVSTQR